MGNALGTPSSSSPWETAKSMLLPPEPEKFDGFKEDSKKSAHPGTVAHIHKKWQEVKATPFDGARVMVNKRVNNHLQVSHIAALGGVNNGYRFGAKYVGAEDISTESYPILLGDNDLHGNLNASLIHRIGPKLQCRFNVQFENLELAKANIIGEYRGGDYSVVLSLVNPDLYNAAGAGVVQYLQSVSNNLALGAELVYHYGRHLPGGQFGACSIVGKYTSANSIWSGTVGTNQLSFCYYERNSPQLQLGLEVQTCLSSRESVATIGYQLDIPKSGAVFRGSADTQMNVCGVLEKRLEPMSLTFALSAHFNCKKNQLQLGCGLTIG